MSDTDIKSTITEQLQHLQLLLHRMTFRGYMSEKKIAPSPYRGQGRVLAVLKLKPEISQKELAYLLDMSKQSLAELLAKLEKNGYIAREPSEEDKRSSMVRLLEKGRQAAEGMDGQEPETSQVLDCLNAQEQVQFSDYLGRVIRECEAYFPGEGYEERRKKLQRFLARRRQELNGTCLREEENE